MKLAEDGFKQYTFCPLCDLWVITTDSREPADSNWDQIIDAVKKHTQVFHDPPSKAL